jgi:hypothetical protein
MRTLLARSHLVEESVLRMHASDGRDRIYSMLGLAIDADELGITADYSKGCREIYINIARALLKQGNLDILAMCRSRGDVPNLPSWVPD